MSNAVLQQQPRHSLKSRYLLFSSAMALILVAGSITASLYVHTVTRDNAESLQLRDSITETIGQVRKSIWRFNTRLNTMLISPRDDDQQAIKQNLLEAHTHLHTLTEATGFNPERFNNPLGKLDNDFDNLDREIHHLLELAQNPNWVYPMLPYINETLLASNTEFETAATLALTEISNDDGNIFTSALYQQVSQIRDLWRLQILEFRAFLIRFAGFINVRYIAQEDNITTINQQIQEKLAQLQVKKEQGLLGLETEEASNIMLFRAKKWYADFKDLLKLRDTNVWRNDVNYITTHINPLQHAVEDDLAELEKSIQSWSSQNTAGVEQAANQINAELWALSVLALSFFVLVYIMLSRSVLQPISRIANALAEEHGHDELLSPPTKSSREIHTLVGAYNTMRQQIHKRQQELRHQALHDALTDLPNRVLLQDRLEQAIEFGRRHNAQATLLLLDLDRFKEINDTLGHAIGDQVLKVTANRLLQCLRKVDTVARLGGDEFAIVSPEIDTLQIKNLLDKIVGCVNQAVTIDGQNLYVGVSIGVAVFPDNGEDANTLIRHADIAMYSAKREQKNYAFFEPRMDRLSVDNLSLLGDLRQELLHPTGQFLLHFQPQIELPSHKVQSAEALLRWQHPKQGFIPPEQVIQMAERSGLIGDLSTWVLARAIQDCAKWWRDDIQVQVAVNLSAWNLQDPALPNLVQQLLLENNLAAENVCLEITESAVMNDPVRAREVLHELSDMGVELVIDDYGTGFSSLAYLKMLPVNGLKIDKSFVIDMLDNENDAIIVQSTIDLAHNLDLTVIAEGVENVDTLLRLTDKHCDYAQGYHLSRPIPESQFRSWFHNHRAGHSLTTKHSH